jgi:hypothetical protein
MKVLFVMLNPGHVGHYDAALRMLIERGHRVVLAYQSARNKDGIEQVYGERLQRDHPDAVEIATAPQREPGGWADLVTMLRQAQDYLRYFRPELRHARALRTRAQHMASGPVRTLVRVIASLGPAAVRSGERLLAAIDRAVPESATITAFVRETGADVLLVTPLVDTNSTQVDFVRAAQRLGVPTGCCVASWDNLTNKGSMRVVPDRVFVWNDAQKQEAVALHRVPPGHVVITGAQLFDRWFGMRPTRSREEFCARVGLPADRPFILYLGSSLFIAPQEGAFAEKWIRAIRHASDSAVRSAGILIRPHPNNATHFMANDFSVFGDVVVWPPFEANRLDPGHDADYFESLFYAAAAVGVNTSSMIEAAIVGRPVHTVLAPDFLHAQRETLHFHHLTTVGGGLLHVAESLDEHVDRLRVSIAASGGPDPRSAAFVADFVRPLGMATPAAPELARAIAAMGGVPVTARRPTPASRVSRVLLYPVAALAATVSVNGNRPWWTSFVTVAAAGWVVAVRVRYAVIESRGWVVGRRYLKTTRGAVRHAGKDAVGWVRGVPRRVHRACVIAWQPIARSLRRSEHSLSLARKRLRRSARVLLKRLRRGTRSATDVLRVPLAALRRR